MGRRKWYAGVGVCWTVGLVALSFLPGQDKRVLHTHGRFHSVGHFAAFLTTALVILRSVRTLLGRALVLLGLGLLSVALEFLQSAHYGYRFVEWRDIVADLLGVLTGAIFYALAEEVRDRRKFRSS